MPPIENSGSEPTPTDQNPVFAEKPQPPPRNEIIPVSGEGTERKDTSTEYNDLREIGRILSEKYPGLVYPINEGKLFATLMLNPGNIEESHLSNHQYSIIFTESGIGAISHIAHSTDNLIDPYNQTLKDGEFSIKDTSALSNTLSRSFTNKRIEGYNKGFEPIGIMKHCTLQLYRLDFGDNDGGPEIRALVEFYKNFKATEQKAKERFDVKMTNLTNLANQL
ncbi:MAG: hypothetical protein ABIC57_03855 [bacterium]